GGTRHRLCPTAGQTRNESKPEYSVLLGLRSVVAGYKGLEPPVRELLYITGGGSLADPPDILCAWPYSFFGLTDFLNSYAWATQVAVNATQHLRSRSILPTSTCGGRRIGLARFKDAASAMENYFSITKQFNSLPPIRSQAKASH